MTRRHYIDNAPTTTLTGSINNSTTTVVVAALSGFPTSFPYPATMGMGTASAEQILVSSAVGTTLTVVRNSNGLGAFSHPAGENFNHTANAVEYDEANAHINASSGVHGITGSVVGTTDIQTLSNKSILNATFAASGGTPGATFTQAAGTDNGWVAKNSGGTVVTKIDGNGLFTTTAVATTGNATVGGALAVTGTTTAAAITSSATVSGSSIVSSNDLTGSTGRLTSTTAVSLASTGHAFQIGATASSNMAFDAGKIQGRNNGGTGALSINALGGALTLGVTGTTVTVGGFLSVGGITDVAGALTTANDSTIGTNAANFAATDMNVWTQANGKVVNLVLTTVNTAAVTASGSPPDFASTPVLTIDAAYRPAGIQVFSWTTGGVGGTGVIGTNGIMTIDTTTGTIAAGQTIRISATYMLA